MDTYSRGSQPGTQVSPTRMVESVPKTNGSTRDAPIATTVGKSSNFNKYEKELIVNHKTICYQIPRRSPRWPPLGHPG